jgi:Fe-S cluster biosynthesis and repair protein YggX
MANVVQCVVLKTEAEAMERPPHPGELGQRIFENVSKEGWKKWLERLTGKAPAGFQAGGGGKK